MTQNGVIVILNRTFFEAGAGKMCGCSSTMAQLIPPTKSSIQHESAVAAPEGEHVTFQIEALGPKIVTMEVFSVQRPSSGAVGAQCSVQAQATVTR